MRILAGMLGFITFLYDVFRFVVLVFLLLPAEIRFTGSDNYFMPNLLYIAPLTLFPVMAFFMWFDSKKYKVFAYLYTSGKIIGLSAVAAAIFHSRDEFSSIFMLLDSKRALLDLILPCLALLDMLFIVPVILSSNGKPQK
jgi:Zn-dependent protease with chaperone function